MKGSYFTIRGGKAYVEFLSKSAYNEAIKIRQMKTSGAPNNSPRIHSVSPFTGDIPGWFVYLSGVPNSVTPSQILEKLKFVTNQLQYIRMFGTKKFQVPREASWKQVTEKIKAIEINGHRVSAK